MDLKKNLEYKLLETIHEWEQKNDPSLPLDFDLFYTQVLLSEIVKNRDLQYTLLLDVPYIPNNVTKLIDCDNVKLPNHPLPSTIKSLSLSSADWLPKNIPNIPDSLEILSISGFFDQPETLQFPSSLRVLNYFIKQTVSFSGYDLPPVPPALESLHCASYLCKLPALPTTLKTLHISYNKLKRLPELPASLEILDASHNALEELPTLPTSLRTLDVSHNALEEIPALPTSLKKLDVSSNCLYELPELPESLCDVSANSNYLSKLPSLPSNLETLSCYNNNIEQLPSIIPPTLKFLIFYNNKFQSKPVLPNTVIEYLGGEFGNRIIPDNPSTEEERQGIMFEL